ncbi:hypothetical protein EC968_004779 [Mortierella alpina]|nr:hypothetical protein EC968_004779 [Mortierella alpina]
MLTLPLVVVAALLLGVTEAVDRVSGSIARTGPPVAEGLVLEKHLPVKDLSRLLDSPMEMSTLHRWSNWAGTQHANPARIYSPTAIPDLQAIIHEAGLEGKKIRCAGSGHSWSSSSVVNDDGYMVNMKQMEKIFPPKVNDGVWTVEVETGVLLADLDHFLRHHNPPLAISSNTVLDTIRYGGVISLGCHGAAPAARTMPDIVTEVKIVDSSGVLRTFSKEKDANEFSAATANLGLLGIIYSYTMIVEPMFKLLMSDLHPPLSDYFGDPDICGLKLKNMALNNDQTEIFYWPFNSQGLSREGDTIWLKQWKRTNRTVTESSLARGVRNIFSHLETKFGNTLFQHMAANPSSTPFVDYLLYSINKVESEKVLYAPEAIHYQPGIDNIPCLSTEMAFKVDEGFKNVVKAGNYVIDQVYEHALHGKFPLNLALEMRFIKSSSMAVSNAYDDDPEAIYCMIEIVSVAGTQGFEEFSAKIAHHWMENFQAMPHWAKMWEHVPGIVPHIRRIAGKRLDKFEMVRKKYDPNGLFMTNTFAAVFGH